MLHELGEEMGSGLLQRKIRPSVFQTGEAHFFAQLRVPEKLG